MEANTQFIYTGYYDQKLDSYHNICNNNNNISNNSTNANNNQFVVDDLLDFSKEDDDVIMGDDFFENNYLSSGNCSDTNLADSSNSSQFSGDFDGRSLTDVHHFATGELYVPDVDVAELEWLSNFVDDSFSGEESHTNNIYNLAPTITNSPTNTSSSTAQPDTSAFPSIPAKARSKRSRAAPCDWSSRLVLVQNDISNKSKTTPLMRKRDTNSDILDRKCLHCGSNKTPQWRLGPMGPKTLCNACGVRYKSGRLVPEYRPAASPTFVATKHSNSHRKVVELRRQKELHGQVRPFHGSKDGDHFTNYNVHMI